MVCRPRHVRHAFTLVELMISIALALILIVGINAVFKISSDTVGGGQALGTISRDDRTAHTTIYNDVHNAVTNVPKGTLTQSPAFFIASSNIFAFRNAADRQSDSDGNPSTQDIGGSSNPVDPVAVNDRSHRVDVLGFFATGDNYPRQTASNGQYVSTTSSSEAFIWYGHLMQPNNSLLSGNTSNAQFYAPGAADASTSNKNDNNALASDWILGRFAMLLTPTPPSGDIFITAATAGGNPLAYTAKSSDGLYTIGQSRYDIVNTSISGSASSFVSLEDPSMATAAAQMTFRDPMIWATATAPGTSAQIFRYQCNPFPAKPMNSAAMALTAPIFLRNCTQFIVEFAGDYVSQAADGTITNTTMGDKTIDFFLDNSVTPPVRKIRWYGFPRNVSGGGPALAGPTSPDVIPVRDMRGVASAFERVAPVAPTGSPATYSAPAYAQNQYVCSWGTESVDPLPMMIRITIALDDPNGRIAGPQFFEYVIDLTQ